MSIMVDEDQHEGVVILKVTGVMEVESFLDVLTAQYKNRRMINDLWDFQEASLAPLSAESIIEMVDVCMAKGVDRKNYKTAIVVSENLEYGLARMFQAYGMNLAFEIGIFRDLDKALEWLNMSEGEAGGKSDKGLDPFSFYGLEI